MICRPPSGRRLSRHVRRRDADRDLSSSVDPELVEDVANVGIHCSLGDEQAGPDRLVGQTLSYQPRDLCFVTPEIVASLFQDVGNLHLTPVEVIASPRVTHIRYRIDQLVAAAATSSVGAARRASVVCRPRQPQESRNIRMTADRVALIDWDESHATFPT